MKLADLIIPENKNQDELWQEILETAEADKNISVIDYLHSAIMQKMEKAPLTEEEEMELEWAEAWKRFEQEEAEAEKEFYTIPVNRDHRRNRRKKNFCKQNKRKKLVETIFRYSETPWQYTKLRVWSKDSRSRKSLSYARDTYTRWYSWNKTIQQHRFDVKEQCCMNTATETENAMESTPLCYPVAEWNDSSPKNLMGEIEVK